MNSRPSGEIDNAAALAMRQAKVWELEESVNVSSSSSSSSCSSSCSSVSFSSSSPLPFFNLLSVHDDGAKQKPRKHCIHAGCFSAVDKSKSNDYCTKHHRNYVRRMKYAQRKNAIFNNNVIVTPYSETSQAQKHYCSTAGCFHFAMKNHNTCRAHDKQP